MVNVPNAMASSAWSADLYDLSRIAYRNNDLRVNMLQYILLLRTMLCFDDCRAWTVLVCTYKNTSGGLNPLILPLSTALLSGVKTSALVFRKMH